MRIANVTVGQLADMHQTAIVQPNVNERTGNRQR